MSDHELPTHKLTFLKGKSLLAIVNNAVRGKEGTLIFTNLYARDETGKVIDILEGGRNSCAAFVSWVLLAVELIKHPHATVASTEKDLMNSGWYEIHEVKPGAILIWEPKEGELLGDNKVLHRHIGFYVDKDMAISNDSDVSQRPVRHHFTFGAPGQMGYRKIQKILWHDALND